MTATITRQKVGIVESQKEGISTIYSRQNAIRKVNPQCLTHYIASARPAFVLRGKKSQCPTIHSNILCSRQKVKKQKASCQKRNVRRFWIQCRLNGRRKNNQHKPHEQLQWNYPRLSSSDFLAKSILLALKIQRKIHRINNGSPKHL